MAWLEKGREQNATHVIIVEDTFDGEDYPVYVKQGEDVKVTVLQYDGVNMQRICEVYNLSMNLQEQVSASYVYNL